MADRPTPDEVVGAAREVYVDAYYRLRQERAVGDADALVHVLEQAERAGVSQNERQQIADRGFRQISDRLVRPPKARRGIRRWLRSADDAPLPGADDSLPPFRRPPELPPGGDR